MIDRRETHGPDQIDLFIARCLAGDACAAAKDIEQNRLWEYVAARACGGEVAGALDQRLAEQGVSPPRWSSIQFKEYRRHIRAANAYRQAHATPVLRHLQRCAIPFMLLKGAALNATVFETPGTRAMVDVDVLIQPSDVGRAHQVLLECGCRPGADLLREDFYPRYYYEREYLTPGSPPVKIDLHCRPFRPLRYARTVPDDALWDEPVKVQWGDIDVLIPRADNMLIHLAGHAACHGLAELKWVYDIHLWLERFGAEIDMDVLGTKCRGWKMGFAVRRALEKVEGLFGHRSGVLAEALEALSGPAGLVDRWTLFQAPRDDEHPVTALLVNMLCTPGARFRLGYLKSVLIPGPGHLGQLYHRRHPGWTWVAHLLRVARGVARPLMPASPEAV